MKNRLPYLLLFIAGLSFGQQEPQFTLYDNNISLVNSGFTGLKNKLYGATNARKQWGNRQNWGGIPGQNSPSSITANVDLALEKQLGGIGLAYVYDEIGLYTTNRFYFNYAYHILKENFQLGIGLGVNFAQTGLSGNFFVADFSDPDLIQLPESHRHLNINPGVYFNHKFFEFGVGVSQLNIFKTKQNLFNPELHLYVNGAFKFDIGEQTKWRVSALYKNSVTASTAEVQIISTIKELIWIGVGVRNTQTINAMAGVKIKKNFNLGYAYEYSKIAFANLHTHEVILSYTLARKE